MYLDSLPRETFIPSASGLLEGVGLVLVACSAVVEADRRWMRGVGAFSVSDIGLLIAMLLSF